MNISILLHLYQPSTQEESVFRSVYTQCYEPLLKLIKNKSNLKITLNTPLSLLEQMEHYGYTDWLKTLKELYENGKVELVGSAAYHPILTKLPTKFVVDQIILNEYGLGYYVGSHKGFEGEPSLMIRDLRGFFSPEMAINKETFEQIASLGYEWVIADECLISANDVPPKEDLVLTGIYHLGGVDSETKIVIRDTKLSNMLSFQSNNDVSTIREYLRNIMTDSLSVIVALDGEAFGHHNKEGISLLDNFIDVIRELGLNLVTISDNIELSDETKLTEINESTWALSREEALINKESNKYMYWFDSANDLQTSLAAVEESFLTYLASNIQNTFQEVEGFETLPVWETKKLIGLTIPEIQSDLSLNILAYKSMQSDKYWCVSNKTINNKLLFNPQNLYNVLSLYQRISLMITDEKFAKNFSKSLDKVKDQLDKVAKLNSEEE